MCTCSSCAYTDSFAGKSFAAWPTGEPAGQRSSEAAYRAHVAHSTIGARKRVDMGPAGAGYYGTPAGMTKAEVEAVLRKSFAPVVEKPSAPRLVHLARVLRVQAIQERRAA